MRYLFDSAALIALFGNEKGARKVEALLDQVERGSVEGYISAITLTEVYYKYAKVDEKAANERIDKIMASKLKVVDTNGMVALRAGKYKLKPIPLADAVIAASAFEQRAHLVADNDKHFRELGINVLNFR